MKKFVCECCGKVYSMTELQDHDGECSECGASIPKNEAAYNDGIKLLISTMASSGNEDCHARQSNF